MSAETEYFRKKYKADELLQQMLKKKNYRDIMVKIFDVNIEELQKKTGQRSHANWKDAFEKATKTGKIPRRKYVLPEYWQVAPTKEQIRARSQGQVRGIANVLRLRLTSDLRQKIIDHKATHKEPTYIKKRVSGKLEGEFERTIKDTFRAYSQKDPILGVPSNVHIIAVTELRTAISTIKSRMAHAIQDANPGTKLKKRWVHNPHLSKKPEYIRFGHRKINGNTIMLGDLFDVPLYRKFQGRQILVETTKMSNPHDFTAPPSQICGCHCDCEYFP